MQIIGASSKSKTFKNIKFGSLLPAENFPKNLNFPNSAGPALVQKVVFNAEKLTRASRSRFAIGTLSGPRGPMMALTLSLGSAVLHWLADPSDPEVWNAIRAWDRQGSVPIALEGKETHFFLIPVRHSLEQSANELERTNTPTFSENFIRQAFDVCKQGLLDTHSRKESAGNMFGTSILATPLVVETLTRVTQANEHHPRPR